MRYVEAVRDGHKLHERPTIRHEGFGDEASVGADLPLKRPNVTGFPGMA